MEEVLKPDEAEAAIEALLFTMGEAISAEAIGAGKSMRSRGERRDNLGFRIVRNAR